MKLNLSPDLAEKVLSLTREYSYTPEEVISIGIALTNVLLKERALGNQVVIVAPDGDQVAEFTEVPPQAMDSIAEKYIKSVYDGILLREDEDGSFIIPPNHENSYPERDPLS
jgi:hypothetical protein